TRVARVNPDPDHVSGLDGPDVDRLQRLVNDSRITPLHTSRGGQDVQPARRNHGNAERLRARVDEMDARHSRPSQAKALVRAWAGMAEGSKKQGFVSIRRSATRTPPLDP